MSTKVYNGFEDECESVERSKRTGRPLTSKAEQHFKGVCKTVESLFLNSWWFIYELWISSKKSLQMIRRQFHQNKALKQAAAWDFIKLAKNVVNSIKLSYLAIPCHKWTWSNTELWLTDFNFGFTLGTISFIRHYVTRKSSILLIYLKMFGLYHFL